MLFCVFYSFPFEAYAVCDIPKSLPPKVKSIEKGVNPSSADKIFFTGDYLGKGFKIGVVSGMVALTVKQNPRAQFLQQCSYRSVLFEWSGLLPHVQEAVAIARTFAAMKDYQIEGNKEMIALGTMNIIGSLTSCYIATGKEVFQALGPFISV